MLIPGYARVVGFGSKAVYALVRGAAGEVALAKFTL